MFLVTTPSIKKPFWSYLYVGATEIVLDKRARCLRECGSRGDINHARVEDDGNLGGFPHVSQTDRQHVAFSARHGNLCLRRGAAGERRVRLLPCHNVLL